MISLILTASDDGDALARLLTALVPAAAEGLVREVKVMGASGAAREVAEDAGADLVHTFGEAFERARSPWIAGVPLDATLAPDWMEIVSDHLRRSPAGPARLVARGFSLRGRAGWLVPKPLVVSAGAVERDLQRIARRGRALRVLDRPRR